MIEINPINFLIKRKRGEWSLTCNRCAMYYLSGDTLKVNMNLLVCVCESGTLGLADYTLSDASFCDFVCGPYGISFELSQSQNT